MKQLYFTNTDQNSVGGRTAVQVRGMSPGLESRRVEAAARYAGYAAPVVQVEHATAYVPPVRLAWLETPDAGRLLCHSTCLGIDPATGKNGHFFSHVLLEVPPTLDAQHAIQTWGSQLWQRADHAGSGPLPEALYLPVSSALGDARLQEFLEQPANRDLFQFILSALLSPTGGRIFVAASAEDVALCVYGVTRALPPGLLADFTFSTYEHDPLSSTARLVGTCWAEGTERELPAGCYEGMGVGFNRDTGRRSPQVVPVPFADFAVEALAGGELAVLDEFHATWQRLGIQNPSLLDLVFRLARGTGTLSKEESHQVVHHPTLGTWIAGRTETLQQFLEWALEDHGYATGTFSRVAALLRQKPDLLAKLAQTVEERGLAALRAGDFTRAPNALEVILPMAAPARAATLWNDLLNTFTDPEALSWEMRCYLLPRLARLQAAANGPALERWLLVAPERLEALLQLDLPRSYQITACQASLRQDGATPALARVLAGPSGLLLPVVKQLAAGPEGPAHAVTLFGALLDESSERGWIQEMVRHADELPPALLGECLEAVLERAAVDVADLARTHGVLLLDRLAEQPALDLLAKRLLEHSADELLADVHLGAFLHGLAGLSTLSPEVRERLDACLTVQTFLRQPSLDQTLLGGVMAALKVEPPLFPPRTLGRVLDTISAKLTVRAAQPEVQAELEGVLLTVGPHTVSGEAGLFRELLYRQQKQKQFWKQPELLHGFLAIALGAPKSPELAGRLDNLEAEAFALARQIGQLGGKKVLNALEQHVETWPRSAQKQWHFLAKAVQPRGVRDLARDVAFFLAGAGVTMAAAWVARWVGM